MVSEFLIAIAAAAGLYAIAHCHGVNRACRKSSSTHAGDVRVVFLVGELLTEETTVIPCKTLADAKLIIDHAQLSGAHSARFELCKSTSDGNRHAASPFSRSPQHSPQTKD